MIADVGGSVNVNDDTEKDADEHQEQVERRQNDGEPLQKRGDFFQGTISSLTFPTRVLKALLAPPENRFRNEAGIPYTGHG